MANNILQHLPAKVKKIIQKINYDLNTEVLEIRLRINQPLQVVTYNNDFFITENGKKTVNNQKAYNVSREDIEEAKLILTKNSRYAMERQFQQGFITIKGGHRVGFTGEVIYENNHIKTIKNINSFNYRITREVIGAGKKIINKIYNNQRDSFYNTLIISPPLCGKTTLLRDLIRLISSGYKKIGTKGRNVGVVDERSEIAGSYNGIAQNNLGSRTDVLGNCPKSEGMMLLIRSMSPEVIAVDEIGGKKDVTAIKEVIKAGVTLITTIHGKNISSIKLKPGLRSLIKQKVFQRYLLLNQRDKIGTIKKVFNQSFKEVS